MPEGHFLDLNSVPSWHQYRLAAGSLMTALKLDNPEESLFVQLTISELSLVSLGLLTVGRMFPELVGLAGGLSDKLTAINAEQGFLTHIGEGE